MVASVGHLEGAINGTCRSFDAQLTDRCLAACEWRFNRRFALENNLERPARTAVGTAPQPRNAIVAGGPPAEMPG